VSGPRNTLLRFYTALPSDSLDLLTVRLSICQAVFFLRIITGRGPPRRSPSVVKQIQILRVLPANKVTRTQLV